MGLNWGREKEQIRKSLQVKAYPEWILVDSHVSDQSDLAQEGEEGEKEVEEEEVEQRVPAATTVSDAPLVPVILTYVRGISEQLKRAHRFLANQHAMATIGASQGQGREGGKW